jgi:hypothetical protein
MPVIFLKECLSVGVLFKKDIVVKIGRTFSLITKMSIQTREIYKNRLPLQFSCITSENNLRLEALED